MHRFVPGSGKGPPHGRRRISTYRLSLPEWKRSINSSLRTHVRNTMRSREGQSLRVAVLARSVYPLHRFGGLERHVYDLVRCLLARDVQVSLITPPVAPNRPLDAAADAVFRHPNCTMRP